MTGRKELIQRAKRMGPKAGQDSFYRYAQSRLSDMIRNGDTDTGHFFNEISGIAKKQNDGKISVSQTVKYALGISGKQTKDLEVWCANIKAQRSNALGKLTIEELCYVMGYCARISKFEDAKKLIESNSGK